MENCVQKIKWLIGDTSIYPVSSLSHEQRSYDSSKLPSGRNICVSDIQVVFKLFKLRSVFTFIKTKIFKCVFYNTNSTNYIHLNSFLFKKIYFLFHIQPTVYFQFSLTYLSSSFDLLDRVSEKLCLESKRSMSQLPDLLLFPQELNESFLSKSKSLSYLRQQMIHHQKYN